jgi:hypothetical protein
MVQYVVEALERAQRRYKLEERPTASEKTAVKVVTGRKEGGTSRSVTISLPTRPSPSALPAARALSLVQKHARHALLALAPSF